LKARKLSIFTMFRRASYKTETRGSDRRLRHTDPLRRKETRSSKKTLEASRTYKTPEQLATYSKKRSFDKTPEPSPAEIVGKGSAFVVHRHHASRCIMICGWSKTAF